MLVATLATAQDVELNNGQRMDVLGHLHYLRDASNTLDIERVQNMPFKHGPPDQAPNFGFDRNTYWFRVDIKNNTAMKDWLMEIDFAPLDSIDFFVKSDTGWIHKTDGDVYPIGQRDINHRQPIFAIDLPEGETTRIFLRVNTTSSLQLPLVLWRSPEFVHASFKIQLFNGLFFGAMVLMTLYQLFLFISVRDRTTLYYVFTLLSMTTIVSYYQGYTFLYLYPGYPIINDLLAIVTGPIFVIFSTRLTQKFLKLYRFNRVLDFLLVAHMTAHTVVAMLMIVFFRQISYQFHHYFILVHCALALISAGYCLYHKYRPALYYLAAWITLLVAALVFTMNNLGFVTGYLSINYLGLMIGCVLQVLFISFALGERLNVLVKENQRAKELELIRGMEEYEKLEQVVQARTEEIQHQKERLEETNRIKDKLFSVVSHDIKGPLSSLKLSLLLAKTGTLKPEEFNHVVAGIETHMEQTTEFIDNLLQWARIQLRGIMYEPAAVDLEKLIDETITLLNPELQEKKIALEKVGIDGPLMAHVDMNMIKSVLRNLLTNAIKFTPANGVVLIHVLTEPDTLTVSIQDTGVGIPAANQERIFSLDGITTKGTKQEAGTGLGLILCKEFVERNKGKIWFESEEGKGTTFYFSLPRVEDHSDESHAVVSSQANQ
jgi:two-component system, sensor histidine kinase LadS